MVYQVNYKGFEILVNRSEAQPFTVCFDMHEADFGDYDSLPQAKKAIDRFLKAAGE